MKITLERFDENFGFKARAGKHEMILDTAVEIGGSDQGFRPMELMLISLVPIPLSIPLITDEGK